jgi:hypothetical protein
MPSKCANHLPVPDVSLEEKTAFSQTLVSQWEMFPGACYHLGAHVV